MNQRLKLFPQPRSLLRPKNPSQIPKISKPKLRLQKSPMRLLMLQQNTNGFLGNNVLVPVPQVRSAVLFKGDGMNNDALLPLS